MEMSKNPQRKALGRGLSALIPGTTNPITVSSSDNAGFKHLPIERIHPNRSQPRKVFDEAGLVELADSIKEHGVLQPIMVRRDGEGYEIVAGERRWRAASRAGVSEIPALVKDLSETQILQVALIENIQRQDLDPIEEAFAYRRLVDEYKMTQEEVATAVGKNRATIANSLRLLKLPEEVLDMLGDGRISAGHARAIMTVDGDKARLQLAKECLVKAFTVRDAERRARQINKTRQGSTKKTKSPAETDVEQRLQRALGTRVQLHHRGGKGKIEISYHSLDELDRIIATITK